jgi:hypothetical protein
MGLLFIVGGALLGGAVAFGVWSLLPDTWRPACWPVAIVAALIVGVNLMQASGPSAEGELLRNPDTRELAQAWNESDPDGFSAFAEHVSEIARGSSSASPSSSINLAVAERLPRLSDADIVALEHNTRDLLLFYVETDPSVCFAFVHGNASLPNVKAVSRTSERSGALRRERLELIAHAFRANRSQPVSAMNDDERRIALAAVGNKLRQVLSDEDVALLQSGAAVTGHERRYCEAMAAYEDALASAPDAGRLYRAILLGQRTAT